MRSMLHLASTQVRSRTGPGPGGVPANGPSVPRDLGAFKHEPVIWADHAVLTYPQGKIPSPEDPNMAAAFEDARMFKCEYQLVEYSILFNYSSDIQFTTVLPNKKFLGVIQNTTLETVNGMAVAKLEENFVFPQDVEHYRLSAAYYSLGVTFRNLMNCTIAVDSNDVPAIRTEAGTTRLIQVDP
jgi:hypothetical protein